MYLSISMIWKYYRNFYQPLISELKQTFRFDYEYEFDCEYDFLETFRFDYEYEFDYEYDFLETFRFDYTSTRLTMSTTS